MDTQIFINLIFSIMEQKVEELGGIEAVKKAIVWDWWQKSDINDERDFDSALDQCYRCYIQVDEARKQMEEWAEVMSLDEDPTNLPS